MKLLVSHLKKTYGARTILDDCSHVFDQTGIHVLMGPNGCGKSTLLRICALLEQPDSGEITYTDNGTALVRNIALMRRMTLLLPRTGVFNTTVYKNAAYGLRIRGLDRSLIEQKVNAALDFVQLGAKAGQSGRTLSSGETQRLGLARAQVLEPECIFLDEPTASIDQKNTELIEAILLNMKKDGKTTVIMTTHDQSQAKRIGDRVLSMREGRLVEEA